MNPRATINSWFQTRQEALRHLRLDSIDLLRLMSQSKPMQKHYGNTLVDWTKYWSQPRPHLHVEKLETTIRLKYVNGITFKGCTNNPALRNQLASSAKFRISFRERHTKVVGELVVPVGVKLKFLGGSSNKKVLSLAYVYDPLKRVVYYGHCMYTRKMGDKMPFREETHGSTALTRLYRKPRQLSFSADAAHPEDKDIYGRIAKEFYGPKDQSVAIAGQFWIDGRMSFLHSLILE